MYALIDRLISPASTPIAPVIVDNPSGALYTDTNERLRHLDEMQRLAQEATCSLQMITPIYEQTLARLKADATIHDYLPILVAKGVKNALKDLARHH